MNKIIGRKNSEIHFTGVIENDAVLYLGIHPRQCQVEKIHSFSIQPHDIGPFSMTQAEQESCRHGIPTGLPKSIPQIGRNWFLHSNQKGSTPKEKKDSKIGCVSQHSIDQLKLKGKLQK